MKFKFFVWICLLFVLVGSVSAAINYTNSTLAYWKFDGDLVDNETFVTGHQYNWTGTANFNGAPACGSGAYNQSGDILTNLDFDSGALETAAIRTIDFWFKGIDADGNVEQLGFGNPGSGNPGYFAYSAGGAGGNQGFFGVDSGGGNTINVVANVTAHDGTWHHIVIVLGPSRIYMDGALVGTDAATATMGATGQTQMNTGQVQLVSNRADPAMFDNMIFVSERYTLSDVQASYNSGSCTEFELIPPVGAPPPAAPAIVITSPTNLTNINSKSFQINYTLSNIAEGLTCKAFSQNTTERFANWDLLTDEPGKTAGNHSTTVTLVDDDDLFAMTVNCNGTIPTSGNLRAFVWVTLDTVSPVLSWTNPVFPIGTRSNDTSFALNFSAFDLNLFGKENNVSCNGTGSFVTKYFNASADLNTTTDNETGIVDLSNTLPGTCLVQATYSDDHTAKVIPDWGVGKDEAKAELLFDTDKGNHINLKLKSSDVALDDFESVKGLDRYRINYYFGGDDSVVHEYVFKLSSSFDIVDRSRFYDFPSFVTGKEWVDFNVVSYYPVSYEYAYVGSGVEVTVRTRDTTLRFDSVGGLNIVNENATFLFDATGPLINDFSPSDNFSATEISQLFTLNASDTSPASAFLWTNETGTWQIEETIGTFTNGGNDSVVHTFSDFGHVLWAWQVYDSFDNVNWSGNRTLNATYSGPVIAESLILSSSNTSSSDLEFWCNATDRDGDVVTYEFVSYLNGVNFSDGNSSGFTPESERVNVANVSSGLLSHTQSWVLSCRAFDNSTFSPWVNSSLFQVFTQFNLFREKTNAPFAVGNADSVELQVFCTNETLLHTFTASSEQVFVSCEHTLLKMDVTYGDDTYFRTLIPGSNLSSVNWWLLDLNLSDIAVQRIIILNDLSGEFRSGTMEVLRVINTTAEIMIRQSYDIENSVTLFLLKNALYSIRLTSAEGAVRVVGGLIADVAAEQTLIIPSIPFFPSDAFLDKIGWMYEFNASAGFLRLSYNDASNTTVATNFTVWQSNSSGTVLFFGSSTTNTSVVYTFNGVVENVTYVTSFKVTNPNINPIDERRNFGGVDWAGAVTGFTPAEWANIKFWAGMIFLVIWGLLFSAVHAGLGMTTTFIWAVILNYAGWIAIPGLWLSFMGVASVLAWITEEWRK